MRRSTLLLLLLFVILAVLSAALRPGVGSKKRGLAKLETAREELAEIHNAVLPYMRGAGSNRELPTLERLITADGDGEFSNLPARDPWGHAYELRPFRGSWPFHVVSCGPDGHADTEDDLSSITGR